MNPKSLQRRPKIFAEKIAQGHSSTEAYYLAGYKPAKRETAHRAASRLYKNPAVRAYIQELRREGDELAREETSLTIAKKLAFLARLVLTSSAALREDDPLIQSHRILKDGSTSIRIPCKLKALKMHSELAGHFLPKPSPDIEPSDPLQELIDQIRQGAPEAFSPDLPKVVPTKTPDRPIASPLECDGIASAPHWHLAPTPQNEHPLPATLGRTEAAAEIERSLERPEGRTSGSSTSLSEGAHISETALVDTASTPRANANSIPEQTPQPQQTTTFPLRDILISSALPTTPAPPPICKLKTEPLQTTLSSPPLTPTQVRKMVIAEIQRSSSISHLYLPG